MKPSFKKFNDLAVQDINFDFHIHTNQTDGVSSPEEIINQAIKLRLKAIAFTDHVDRESSWFNEFSKKINFFKNNKKIKIFLGIEAKALDFDGTLDVEEDTIAKSDIVIGSVHRYPDGKGGFISLEKIKDLGEAFAAKIEFDLAMGLLKNKKVDVLGHPFGVYYRIFGELPINYLELLLVASVKNKTAVEINTKYLANKELFFNLFKKINPFVSIGSDAHSKEELGRSFNIIREEIKR